MTSEILSFLQKIELFSAVSHEALEKLASLLQETSIPAGEILIRQGEIGDCLSRLCNF